MILLFSRNSFSKAISELFLRFRVLFSNCVYKLVYENLRPVANERLIRFVKEKKKKRDGSVD